MRREKSKIRIITFVSNELASKRLLSLMQRKRFFITPSSVCNHPLKRCEERDPGRHRKGRQKSKAGHGAVLPFEVGEKRAETYKKCDSFLYSVCLSVCLSSLNKTAIPIFMSLGWLFLTSAQLFQGKCVKCQWGPGLCW